MITFLPIGGGNEIGANSYYLNFNGNGIILDCGIHPQKAGLQSLPNFDLLNDKPIDTCLISHAHQDHIGSLPFLVKKFPYTKIITKEELNPIPKEQWDISDLEAFFTSKELPTNFSLNGSIISNVSFFVKNHLSTIKANNGKRTFLPYLHRLEELKNAL